MRMVEKLRSQKKSGITAFDIVAAVVERWRFIGVSTITACTLIVLFSIYTQHIPGNSPMNPLPDRYTSKATVFLVQVQNGQVSNGSSVSPQNLTGLHSIGLQQNAGSSIGGFLSSMKAFEQPSAEFALALLTGNTVADEVSKHFDFAGRYHIRRNSVASTRKIFFRGIKARYDTASGMISVSYTDTDRRFAREVLKYSLDALIRRFDGLALMNTGTKVKVLQQQVRVAKRKYVETQDRLIRFEQSLGLADPTAQFNARVDQLRTLETRLVFLQIKLETLRRYGSRKGNRLVVQAKIELSVLRDALDDLQSGKNRSAVLGVPADQIPRRQVEYRTLKLDAAIARSLFSTLKQAYENAGTEEIGRSTILQIVDPPQVPELASSPNRTAMTIWVTISVFIFACFIAGARGTLERAKRDPRRP